VKKFSRSFAYLGLAGLASLLMAAPAEARVLSDQLTITDGGGKVVKKMTVFEDTEKVGVHGATGIAFDPTQFGNYIALYDIGPVYTISDIVGIHEKKTPTGLVMSFGFASDTETQSPSFKGWTAPGITPPPIPENGPIDVTRFLDPGLRANNWHATFFSDSEAVGAAGPSTVPEPAAWAMLLLGLGGVGAVLRSARRKAATASA
jgi:hypothetical protein